MRKRVNCFIAGCNTCSNAILVEKKFYWEEQLYFCIVSRKKCNRIDAKDCEKFQCNTHKTRRVCNSCRKR